MKKVLFATTALVASAGIAAAEIDISGFAEMGISGSDNVDPTFHTDLGLNFNLSGETDNGLSFGAHLELDDTNGSGATNGGWGADNESIFLSGNFGTVTMGETDGALDKVLKEVALAGGTLTDDETAHDGYNGNAGFDGTHDNQVLRYDYSFGAFSIAASYEQANNGQDSAADQDDNIAIGVKYSTELGGIGMDFGLAYQMGSDSGTFAVVPGDATTVWTNGEAIGASVTADFNNGFMAGLSVLNADFDDSGTVAASTVVAPGTETTNAAFLQEDFLHYGIGVAYEFDAFTVAANYGNYDFDTSGDVDGFGLVVNYDLGGGATVQLGYGSDDTDDTYSLGVAMSF